MKTTLHIPVHSFVDLITNSSSETYVTADRQTVKAVKEAVDSILALAGHGKKCDDYFEITLRTESGYGDYKVIDVVAKDSKNQKLAAVIEALQDAFQAEEIGDNY